MRLALVGGAAAVAGLAAQPRPAQAGHDGTNVFHLGGVVNTYGRGVLNVSGTSPTMEILNASGTAIFGNATGFAPAYGVHGHSSSPTGIGVFGTSNTGVAGTSTSPFGTPTGVRGYASAGSGPTFGVDGLVGSTSGTGVRGRAIAGTGLTFGVVGESSSASGTGVRGAAPAVGVEASASGLDGIGVKTSGDVALQAMGRSRFSTVKALTIPANKKEASHAVTDPNVGTSTFISVTLNSDPGDAKAVRFVEPLPGVGFRIHFEEKIKTSINIAYWLADPVP